MNFFIQFFQNIFGGLVQWKSLKHHGPVFINYIHKQNFEIYAGGQKIDFDDEQKYFVLEFLRMFIRELLQREKIKPEYDYRDLKEHKFESVFSGIFIDNFF